jgi:hypothetical protein
MFCAAGLIFRGTVTSCFHVLLSRTCFSAVPSVLRPVHIFSGTEGVGSRFQVLHAQTRFRRYQGLRVPFSCFALQDTFSAERRASGLVFMFCALGLIFGGSESGRYRFHVLRSVLVFDGTDGAESRFHVLRSLTHFRRYRARRLLFSCFAFSDSFLAIPRASTPVFLFCAPDSFPAVWRASDLLFMFCSPGLVFPQFRGRRVPFSCFASVLIFDGTEGVGFRFQVLHAQTCFR